jgi:hypothetical protein
MGERSDFPIVEKRQARIVWNEIVVFEDCCARLCFFYSFFISPSLGCAKPFKFLNRLFADTASVTVLDQFAASAAS